MVAIHDHFSRGVRNCLKTACMGLGLARLLQDAGRTEEARAALALLENGFQDAGEASDKPRHQPGRNRLKGTSRFVGKTRRAPREVLQ